MRGVVLSLLLAGCISGDPYVLSVSPDGRYRIEAQSRRPFWDPLIPRGPGQGSDVPGRVRLVGPDGKVCETAPVELLSSLSASDIHWSDREVDVTLIAHWPLTSSLDGSSSLAPREAPARYTASEAPAEVHGFVAWLLQHPEVNVATLIRDAPMARLRYSDAAQTVVGAMQGGRAVCVRHPAAVRSVWGLPYVRRADGHPVRGVALGPLPGDEHHAAAYEFRFPEATVHARDAIPLKVSDGRAFIEYPSSSRSAAAAAPALPSTPCPPWAGGDALSVGLVSDAKIDEAILNIDDGPAGVILCHHTTNRWECFPPIHEATIDEMEPAVPAQDKRLPKEGPAFLRAAQVACDPEECTLLLEWDWERQRIAHTYRWDGSFVTLHRVRGANETVLGHLRTSIRASDNEGRRFLARVAPALTSPACFELTNVPPPKNLWPDAALKPPPAGGPFVVAAPGTYCVVAAGLCRKDPPDGDASGLPGCRP